MSSTNREQLHFGNLVRDPGDGAYHCPKCQAPFTRRSNLRRHYAIHTRSMPFKCTVCGKESSHSDEFHLHILTCAQDTRNSPPEYLSQAIIKLQGNLEPSTGHSGDLAPSLSLGNSLISPSSSQVTTGSEIDQTTFPQWMPSWTSETSSPLTPSPYNDPEMSIFSSIPSDVTAAPSGIQSQFVVRPSPRRDSKPYDASRRKTKDRPVYTRRQVDDMLRALSACFTQTLQDISRQWRDRSVLSPVVHQTPNFTDVVQDRCMGIVVAQDIPGVHLS